ncbi:MAG: MYXO-CTERM sorting domain-containing protein [Polyangiaceae bacterium]
MVSSFMPSWLRGRPALLLPVSQLAAYPGDAIEYPAKPVVAFAHRGDGHAGLVSSLAALIVILGTSPAWADAVPPPPDHCPKGQVGVTSHGGPRCVPEAPDDCAPGYRGQVGGECILAKCSSHDQCQDGEECMRVDTCQEFRELHWTGWGWSAEFVVPPQNFFAGPPRPAPPGPPEKAWVELNICGQDGPCNAPAKCRPSSLCYPTAAVGKTKAKVNAPGSEAGTGGAPPDAPPTSTTELPTTEPVVDPVPAPTAPTPDPPPADGGGCRKGCSTTAAAAAPVWLGLPVLGLAALWLRRRRT